MNMQRDVFLVLCRPSGADNSLGGTYLGLTPQAKLCRRFAAVGHEGHYLTAAGDVCRRLAAVARQLCRFVVEAIGQDCRSLSEHRTAREPVLEGRQNFAWGVSPRKV